MSKDSKPTTPVEKIMPFVRKDEKLISGGTFETRISVTARSETAEFSDLANRNHLIGVTDKRLIVLTLDRKTGMPSKKDVFSISFADVKIEDDGLSIKQPDNEKPVKYSFVYGYKINKDLFSTFYPEFIEALEKGKKTH